MKFRVDGFKDLDRVLQELPKTTAKASSRRVLKKGAKVIADEGERNAPKAAGDLKESYGVGTRLTKAARRRHRKKSPVEVFAGPKDVSAHLTEFGTAKMEAQPHLRPAWDAKKRDALDVIKDELAVDVEKTVARYRKRQAKRGRK